jgi:hypothetical protein
LTPDRENRPALTASARGNVKDETLEEGSPIFDENEDAKTIESPLRISCMQDIKKEIVFGPCAPHIWQLGNCFEKLSQSEKGRRTPESEPPMQAHSFNVILCLTTDGDGKGWSARTPDFFFKSASGT